MAITKAEFIKAMLETAGPLDAPAAVKASPSLPGAFGQHGFGKKAVPAPAATSFALRLMKLLGLKNEQHLPTKEVIVGANPAADYLPDRIFYWRRSTDVGHHTLLLELGPTGLELLANKKKKLFHEFYREQRLEDALHRLIQYTLDGFERGGKDRTADIERGQRGETLVIVSVRDDRIDAKDPDQLVCFGTFRDGTDESSLDSFVISDEARRLATSNRALAEDHLGRIYDRRISKLVTDKWQDAFITRQERDAIRKLREACKVGATPVDIAQAAKTLIQAIAQNHRKASAQQPLVFEPLRPDHHIGADPEKAGDADFQNPLAGIVIRDSDAKVLGYVVYCLTGKEDAQQLASTLRKHNAFDNVLFIYPDEGGATLELWQGSRPLVGKLTKSGTRFDGDSVVVTLLSRFFIVSQARVKSAKDLAEQLAKRAKFLKAVALRQLHDESGKGHLSAIYASFKQGLIADLTEEGFADAFAETVANGLLTARWASRHASAHARFTVTEALKAIPVTNPFLRGFFASLHDIRKENEGALYLWLVDDIVGLLERVDVSHVFDFNPEDEAAGKDPVIHFFEDFLAVYDKERKTGSGVFYTPRPVVSYIVRAVHETLQKEFGLEHGLADTTTWAELARRRKELSIPAQVSKDQTFVQILDFSTGTGTFLVEVIDVIHRTMEAAWKAQGHDEQRRRQLWNDYVPMHLLPRLHGYELLMAAYATAHLKIGLKLRETGYHFATLERARIFLTNALDAPKATSGSFHFALDALTEEAREVNRVKRETRFTVVVGNPPYSHSVSEPAWLMELLEDWKRDLNETKSDLNREEWKFLRLAQHLCDISSAGVIGVIINRDFLDGVAKRVMRQSLQTSLPTVRVVDLNGDVKGNISDENVFDIAQGVAIAVLTTCADGRRLLHTSRVGTRAEKFAYLGKAATDAELENINVHPPYFRWVPYAGGEDSAEVADQYASWFPISEMFGVWSSGIQTKNDPVCIGWTSDEIWKRVKMMSTASATDARKELGISKTDGAWSIEKAQADLRRTGLSAERVRRILYRPFDWRFTYFTERSGGFLGRPRFEVMKHMAPGSNIGLIFNRQVVGEQVTQFGVSRDLICHGTFYLGNKGQDFLAPLFLSDGKQLEFGSSERHNLSKSFLDAIERRLGTATRSLKPMDVLTYIYAVVHSPTYRRRYSDHLKLDFPRVPLVSAVGLFRALSRLGAELVGLHLFESGVLSDTSGPAFVGDISRQVERVDWTNQTIWIDAPATRKGQAPRPGTTGFVGVSQDVWHFQIGGYQVCDKWLKDRKGRKLTYEDITHYQKIVVAISETIRIMAEIDQVIEAHGGWPGAFESAKSDP